MNTTNENIQLNENLITLNIKEINRCIQRIRELTDENIKLAEKNRKLRSERKGK